LHRKTISSIHRCPFRVIAIVGQIADTILLPEGCKLHPTFHVSQLKKYLGKSVVPSPHLPLTDDYVNIQVAPKAILERKLVPMFKGISIHVVHWLVQNGLTYQKQQPIGRMLPLFRKYSER
jgi:hypothetical protein